MRQLKSDSIDLERTHMLLHFLAFRNTIDQYRCAVIRLESIWFGIRYLFTLSL